MSRAFIPGHGLYTYMARTIMNEPSAYNDLVNTDEVWITDGQSHLELEN